MSNEPFAHTCGPRDARLVFIAEAWGEQEERQGGVPLVGATGRELARLWIEAGYDMHDQLSLALACPRDEEWIAQREFWLHSASILLTNVFALRPPGNNLGHLCAGKSELPTDYALPQLRNENPRYVKHEYLPHLSRLQREIAASPRNLVVLLGSTACWSMVGSCAIGKLRGAVAGSSETAPAGLQGVKVLPTYHPAAIFRNWGYRPIILADLLKAHREQQFAHITRPQRRIVINPTMGEIAQWVDDTLLRPAKFLAPDIETHKGQIRAIGFARSRDEVLVIPFISSLSGNSYWATHDDELRAWSYVRMLLDSPIPKIFQNGMFDLQYLTRMGLYVRNALHDTMLLHHVLFPELPKDLGFLGSIYTNEPAWKMMRKHKGEEELKRDE
jgi:uracil-DNA glycosylase